LIDEPFTGVAAISLFFVAKLAKKKSLWLCRVKALVKYLQVTTYIST
jgi:hypothetical protein